MGGAVSWLITEDKQEGAGYVIFVSNRRSAARP